MSQLPPEPRTWRATPEQRYERFPLVSLEDDYDSRLAFSAARHGIVLGLGSIPIEIRTDCSRLFDYISEVMGPFSETSEPVLRLAIGQTEGPLPLRKQLGTMAMYARGSRVVAKFREMAGFLDVEAGVGRCLLSGHNFRQDLANYLRFVMNAITPSQNAVLFHTAAIARDGKAYVFYGPSTAGKSTLSALAARRYQVMTDDMLILRYADGQLRAATCGFWGGETTVYPTKHLDLPIHGLYRLHKADSNRVERLSNATGAIDLVCQVPSMIRSALDHQRILDFMGRAAATVPFFELHFHKRDDSFWSTIDGLA